MTMTREEILGAVGGGGFKHAVEAVPVPELGDGREFFVRGLTAMEFDAIGRYSQQLAERKVPAYGWRALTMAMGICDSTGKRLFTDADANSLCQLPSKVASRVVDVIDRLSATSKEEQESLAKNSKSPPTEVGCSSLPAE